MNSKIFRNQCNLEATIKSTCDVLDACKELNIKAWFAWGALLGLVRENRLLPWNNDVELMVIAEENYHRRALNLAKILERIGYHSTYYKDMSVLAIRSLVDGVNINLNFAMLNGDEILRPHEEADGNNKDCPLIARTFWKISIIFKSYSFVSPKVFLKLSIKYKLKYFAIKLIMLLPDFIKNYCSNKFHLISNRFGGKSLSTILPSETILPLQKINFYGRKELAPNKLKDFLIYVYGEDWKIPKENWSFYSKKNKRVSKLIYKDINLFGFNLFNKNH